MNDQRIPIDRHTWTSFIVGIKHFATSEQAGGKAKLLMAVLILFLLGLNGLNVLNSYVSRDFMTAIENRNLAGFIRMTIIYIGVFAAITIVSVLYSFIEQRLGLLWREWASRQTIGDYANHRVYYHLKLKGEVGNPDQRIADDIRVFSATTLSFVLILLNASFTVIAFSGVLWSISPLLFVVAVLYAAAGTLLTFLFGRPLVRLNYDQSDREANFRSALIYLRGNAESVALSRREGHLIQLSLKTLRDLAANFRRIIAVNRNVGFFTTGYNWLVQIIPAVFVAPLFISGKVEFGVISQSAIGFTHLLGAFSIIVTQFQSISSYTAVLARLSSLREASEREKAAALSNPSVTREDGRIAYQGLTLCSPRSGRVLIKDLSIEIPHGKRVLVRGHDETARSALFLATGALWEVNEGHIVRPNLEQVLLLPELPYLPPGTVRELLMRPWPEAEGATDHNLETIQVPEEQMLEALRTLKIDSLLKGFGGLDTRHHWENTLPLDEQQLLVVARILLARPRFVFLDRPSTTLHPEQVDGILGLLKERDITYVTFEGEDEDRSVNLESYDALLELKKAASGHGSPPGGDDWGKCFLSLPICLSDDTMQSRLLDDFEDLTGWTSSPSGEARLTLSPDQGQAGKAMRLDFDFHGGGGFVVARKAFSLDIPESYSFGFHIRGSAPRNIFEFKLVDGSNQNVWRYRVEEFAFPEEWQSVRLRNSQIDFAWGPLGGGPPRGVAAIEIVIAAGPGGKGTVWIDDLSFQDDTYRSTPLVRASSALPDHDPQNVLDPSNPSSWRTKASREPQWLQIDFQQEREYGGLVIQWERGFRGKQFDVQVSADGLAWNTASTTTHGDSERSYLFLPHTLSRYLRLNLYRSVEGRGFGIRGIVFKPHDFSRSLNHFFQNIAREHPAGLYPKYLLGRQTYWTPVGTGEGDGQALLNEEGMVEVDKGSFSIMPFLYANGRLLTWADVTLEQGLTKEYLPIPYAEWRADSLLMTTTAFAAGKPGKSILYLRYRLENTGGKAQSVILFAAILPLQVTPTWQNWRSYGGVSPVRELSWLNEAVWVNGTKAVVPLTAAGGFGAAAFAQGWVTERLVRGELPPRAKVKDEFGHASGALRFDLELSPHSAQEVVLAVPFGMVKRRGKGLAGAQPQGVSGAEAFENAVKRWETRLGAVDIRVPAQAHDLADTFRTTAAHILINRDGPALHPGPRRYNRSWIRDGAIMGAALLRMGFPDPIRDFIQWYAKYQTEDGNIPDCVDREGAEWLPEFDAYGQFIFAVVEYYRFTGDRAFLSEMRPAATRALAFMEGLRSKRLTPEYRTPEKKACYGLLPESMSHEGYMAHPVHAYWDDFWAIRGIRDAALMAKVLGDAAEAARLSALLDSFSHDVRASLAATMERHKINFVPGSVEFGDFDPTATSIAVNLLGQLDLLPRTETHHTFDKYLAGFRERASGAMNWNNYSAYEIRIIGALIRLGRRREAMELTRFMLADRRIPAWNQWPEISWRDPLGPSFIGDLPHTWISGEYILAVRTMFAYEREEDEALVIAAGVAEEWLTDGFPVGVRGLPTYYGNISYSLRLEGKDTLRLTLEGDLKMPQGGIVVQPPLPRPIQQVEVNGKALKEFSADSFTCRECPAEAVVKFECRQSD